MHYVKKVGVVAIPEIFYKIIYAEDKYSGIVIIGVNDVFATLQDIKKKYTYCPDVFDQVTDIEIKERGKLSHSYIYMCTLQTFFANDKLKAELPSIKNVAQMQILNKNNAKKSQKIPTHIPYRPHDPHPELPDESSSDEKQKKSRRHRRRKHESGCLGLNFSGIKRWIKKKLSGATKK